MDLSKIYAPRPDWVHKGNYGSVLVVCGSKFYSGSATLAGVSALRSGADLVTVVAPQRAADVASHTLPDLITYPLKGEFLTARHVPEIMDLAHVRKINSVVLGCGLGRHNLTLTATRKLISKFTVPMVLDADALLALSQKPKVAEKKHFILTPHAQELSILLKGAPLRHPLRSESYEDQEGYGGQAIVGTDFEKRLNLAKNAAIKYQSVVLLKGHIDVITDGEMTVTNNSGSPQMTKGGFGDTLAGVIGSLLARGEGLFEAAHVGAYINGGAGQMAADNLGEGVVASDIFEYIPKAIKS